MPIQNVYQNPFDNQDEELASLYEEAKRNSEDNGVLAGAIKSGFSSLGAGFDSALAAGARSIGLDSLADNRERAADKLLATAQGYAHKTPQFSDIHGVGDATDWALGMLGSNIPLLAGMAGTGAAGSILGSRLKGKAGLVHSAGKAAAQRHLEVLKSKGIEGPAAKESARLVAEAAREAARNKSPLSEAVRQALYNENFGAKAGRHLGAAVPYAATTIGSTYDALRQDPNASGTPAEQARAAILSGLGQTAIGTMLEPLGVAEKLVATGKAARQAKRLGAPHKGLSPLQTFALATGGEGITEGLENVIQQKTQQIYNPDLPFDYSQLAENALGGVVVGGAFNAPFTAHALIQNRNVNPENFDSKPSDIVASKLQELEASTPEEQKSTAAFKLNKTILEAQLNVANADKTNAKAAYTDVWNKIRDISKFAESDSIEAKVAAVQLHSMAKAIEVNFPEIITPEVKASFGASTISTATVTKGKGPTGEDLARQVSEAPATTKPSDTVEDDEPFSTDVEPRANTPTGPNVPPQLSEEELAVPLGYRSQGFSAQEHGLEEPSMEEVLRQTGAVPDIDVVEDEAPPADLWDNQPEDFPSYEGVDHPLAEEELPALPSLRDQVPAEMLAPKTADPFAQFTQPGAVKRVPAYEGANVAETGFNAISLVSGPAAQIPGVRGKLFGTIGEEHRFLNQDKAKELVSGFDRVGVAKEKANVNERTAEPLSNFLMEQYGSVLKDMVPEGVETKDFVSNLAQQILASGADENASVSKNLGAFFKTFAEKLNYEHPSSYTEDSKARQLVWAFDKTLSPFQKAQLGLPLAKDESVNQRVNLSLVEDPTGRVVVDTSDDKGSGYIKIKDPISGEYLELPKDITEGFLYKKPLFYNGERIPRAKIVNAILRDIKEGRPLFAKKIFAAAQRAAEMRTVEKTRPVSTDTDLHGSRVISSRPTPVQKPYKIVATKITGMEKDYGEKFTELCNYMLNRSKHEGGQLVLVGTMDNNLYFAPPTEAMKLFEDLGIDEDIYKDLNLLERVGVILKKQSGREYPVKLDFFASGVKFAQARAEAFKKAKPNRRLDLVNSWFPDLSDERKVALSLGSPDDIFNEITQPYFHTDETHDGLMIRDENIRLCQAVTLRRQGETNPRTGRKELEADKGMARSLLEVVDYELDENGNLVRSEDGSLAGTILGKEKPSLNLSLQFKKKRNIADIANNPFLWLNRMFPPAEQKGNKANLQQVLFSYETPIEALRRDRINRFTNVEPGSLFKGQKKAKRDVGVHDGYLVDDNEVLKKSTEVAARTSRGYTLSSELVGLDDAMLLPKTFEEMNKHWLATEGRSLQPGDKVIIHRDPSLSDGSSMHVYTFAGVMQLSARDQERGIVVNPKNVLWKEAAGDFDGDAGVVMKPDEFTQPKDTMNVDPRLSYVKKGEASKQPSQHGARLLNSRRLIAKGSLSDAQISERIKQDALTLEATTRASAFSQMIGQIMALAQTLREFGLENTPITIKLVTENGSVPTGRTDAFGKPIYEEITVPAAVLLAKIGQASISAKKKATFSYDAIADFNAIREEVLDKLRPKMLDPVTGAVRTETRISKRGNPYEYEFKEPAISTLFRRVLKAPTEIPRELIVRKQNDPEFKLPHDRAWEHRILISSATRTMQQLLKLFSPIVSSPKYVKEFKAAYEDVQTMLEKDFGVPREATANGASLLRIWNQLSDKVNEYEDRAPGTPMSMVKFLSRLVEENPDYQREDFVHHNHLLRERKLFTELAFRALSIGDLFDKIGVTKERKSMPSVFRQGAMFLAVSGENQGAAIVKRASKEYIALAKERDATDPDDQEALDSIKEQQSEIHRELEFGYAIGHISGPALYTNAPPSLSVQILPASEFERFKRAVVETSKPMEFPATAYDKEGNRVNPSLIKQGVYFTSSTDDVLHHVSYLDKEELDLLLDPEADEEAKKVVVQTLIESGDRLVRMAGKDAADESAMQRVNYAELLSGKGSFVFVSLPKGYTSKADTKSASVNVWPLDYDVAKEAITSNSPVPLQKLIEKFELGNYVSSAPIAKAEEKAKRPVKFYYEAYKRKGAGQFARDEYALLKNAKVGESSDLDRMILPKDGIVKALQEKTLVPGEIIGVTDRETAKEKAKDEAVFAQFLGFVDEEGKVVDKPTIFKKRIGTNEDGTAKMGNFYRLKVEKVAEGALQTLTTEQKNVLRRLSTNEETIGKFQELADKIDELLGAEKGSTQIVTFQQMYDLLKGREDVTRDQLQGWADKAEKGLNKEPGGNRGGYLKYKDKHYIYVAGGSYSELEQIAILSHEIGHRITNDAWDSLRTTNMELARRIYDDFRAWYYTQPGADQAFEMRALKEWVADQASMWLIRNDPAGEKQVWFKQLANKFLAAYQELKTYLRRSFDEHGIKDLESVDSWMKSIFNKDAEIEITYEPRANTAGPGEAAPGPDMNDYLKGLSSKLNLKELQNAATSIAHLFGSFKAPKVIDAEAAHKLLTETGDSKYLKFADKILAQAKDKNTGIRGLHFVIDGQHYIWIAGKNRAREQVALLSHELGHWVIENEFGKLAKSNAELHAKIKALFTKDPRYADHTFAKALKDEIGKEEYDNLAPEDRKSALIKLKSDKFHEWLADNIAAWVIKEAKKEKGRVRNAVDSWFKKVAKDIFNLFGKVKEILNNLIPPGIGFPKVDQSIEAWLNGITMSESGIERAFGTDTGGSITKTSIADKIARRNVRLQAWATNPDKPDVGVVDEMVPYVAYKLDELLNPKDAAMLRRVSNDPAIRRRLVHLLGVDSQASKDLSTNSDKAAAYLYVLASAKILMPGPEVTGVMETLKQALQLKVRRSATTSNEEANSLIGALNTATTMVPVTKPLIDRKSPAYRLYLERQHRYASGVIGQAQRFMDGYSKMLGWYLDVPYTEVMRTNVPILRDVATRLQPMAWELGGFKPGGMVEAEKAKAQRFFVRGGEILIGLTPEERAELKELLYPFSKGGKAKVSDEAHAAKKNLQQLLDVLYDYMTQKVAPPTGSFNVEHAEAVPLIDVPKREDYWPFMTNKEFIQGNIDEVADTMMHNELRPGWENVRSQYVDWIKKNKDPGRDKTVDDAIDRINNMSLRDFIKEYLQADDDRLLPGWQLKKLGGQRTSTPGFRFKNPRLLDFLLKTDDEELHRYVVDNMLETDPTIIITRYVKNVVKRVEHERLMRTLPGGSIQEVWKIAKQQGATDRDINKMIDYIDAINGMLGIKERDALDAKIDKLDPDSWLKRFKSGGGSIMNEDLNAARSWIHALIDVAHLTLNGLTSLTDPFGTLVSTGNWGIFKDSMAESFDGLVRIMKNADPTEMDLMIKLLGIKSHAFANEDLQETHSGPDTIPAVQKLLGTWFRLNGVDQIGRFTTDVAGRAAFIEIGDLVRKYNEGADIDKVKGRLAELGLTIDDIENHLILDSGTGANIPKILDWQEYMDASQEEKERDDRVRQAIFRHVEMSQIRPGPTIRSLIMSNPYYSLVSVWRGFIEGFDNNIMKPAWAKLVEEGNAKPVAFLALSFIPVLLFAEMVREAAKMAFSDDRDEYGNKVWTPAYRRDWTLGDYISYATVKAGFLGSDEIPVDVVSPVTEGLPGKAMANAAGVVGSDIYRAYNYGKYPLPASDLVSSWGA